MRSLRTRLLALWLMVATSAAATGFVLFEFYRQSAHSQIMRAEDVVARSCRDIGERYAFVMAGREGGAGGIAAPAEQRGRLAPPGPPPPGPPGRGGDLADGARAPGFIPSHSASAPPARQTPGG